MMLGTVPLGQTVDVHYQMVRLLNSLYSNTLLLIYQHLSTVPSASPQNLTVVNITANTVEIQWEEIAFLNQNGPFFLYNVSISQGSTIVNSLTTSSTSALFTNLMPFTNYSIQVSGVNIAGIGPPSNTLNVITAQSSEYHMYTMIYTHRWYWLMTIVILFQIFVSV